MYDLAAMENIRFRADRLTKMMEKRDLSPGQVQYLTGISQSMISLLQSDSRPNVSVVNVAKLADALGCSVDYLVGLSDDPTPMPMVLDDDLHHLVRIARKLPKFRLDDLVDLAELYAEKNEGDDTHLMNVVLEKINEVGGDEAEQLILDLLESLRGSGGDISSPTPPIFPTQ